MFQHIMIDEAQDCNALQYSLAKQFATPQDNLFIVGDFNQSIMGFQGAVPDIYEQFKKDFTNVKEMKDVTEMTLSSNFRCSREIVEVSKHYQWMDIKSESRSNIDGRLLHMPYSKNRGHTELADYVTMVCGSGTKPARIAVLCRFRSVASQVTTVLRDAGIKAEYVTETLYYDREEVATLTAHLQFLYNPADMTAFARVCKVVGGVGKKFIENGSTAILEGDFADYYDYAMNSTSIGKVAKSNIDSMLGPFVAFYSNDKDEEHVKLRKFIREIAAPEYSIYTHYQKRYTRTLEKREGIQEGDYEKTADYHKALNNASRAVDMDNARMYRIIEVGQVLSEHRRDLESMLEHIELQTLYKTKQIRFDKVQVMTIHSAKGLEFESVIIIGSKDWQAIYEQSPDEEMRVIYVALTRSRGNVLLYGNGIPNTGDIPAELVHEMKHEDITWGSGFPFNPCLTQPPDVDNIVSQIYDARQREPDAGKLDIYDVMWHSGGTKQEVTDAWNKANARYRSV